MLLIKMLLVFNVILFMIGFFKERLVVMLGNGIITLFLLQVLIYLDLLEKISG